MGGGSLFSRVLQRGGSLFFRVFVFQDNASNFLYLFCAYGANIIGLKHSKIFSTVYMATQQQIK